MQRVLLSLSGLFLVSDCTAEDLAERRSITSPDKQFAVVFPDRQSFMIQDIHGTTVVFSRDFPSLHDIAEFRSDHVSWSPDSQMLALAGGGGHDLETFIFVRRANTFAVAAVPRVTADYDNPYITPFKWLKGRRLILDISGPHAGKSPGYRYSGRATLRISVTAPACEVLYKRITDHHYTEAEPMR